MSYKIGAQEMRNIAEMIVQRIDDKSVGFVLLTFDFGEGGLTNYISNAKRKDIVKYFEELLAKWDTDERPTFEEN